MDLDDTLRDRLSAAATTTTTRPLRAASTVRRSAERHRARRRGAAAVAVVATAAVAVALGTGLGPRLLSAPPAQDPTPSVTEEVTPPPTTPAPSPTTPPTQTETEPPPPAVTQEEATAFVEAFRFEDEAAWAEDEDFPPFTDASSSELLAFGCAGEDTVSGASAARVVVWPGPDNQFMRQLGVFQDAGTAATAFSTMRTKMRACHAVPNAYEEAGRRIETSYVGGQLALGDESFWVASKQVVASSDDGTSVGEEVYVMAAALLVRSGTTVTVIEDPAWTDAGRAEFVTEASGEWERLRPQLEGVGG